VDVGSVTDVSAVHASFILKVEECRMGCFYFMPNGSSMLSTLKVVRM
jgi:hypothetical protein